MAETDTPITSVGNNVALDPNRKRFGLKSMAFQNPDALDPERPDLVMRDLEGFSSSLGKLRIAVYIILGAYILSYTRVNGLQRQQFKEMFCTEDGPSERTVDRYTRFANSLLPVVSKNITNVGDGRVKIVLDPEKTSPKAILENLTPAKLTKISLTLNFNSILEAEASMQGSRRLDGKRGKQDVTFGNARREFVRTHDDLSDLASVPDNVGQDDLKVLRGIRSLVDKILEANNEESPKD